MRLIPDLCATLPTCQQATEPTPGMPDKQNHTARLAPTESSWERFMEQNRLVARYLARVRSATLLQTQERDPMNPQPHWPQPSIITNTSQLLEPTPLVFTERDLAQRQTGRIVNELMDLSDTQESVHANASRFRLRFDGMRNDRREIYEIPSATLFFRSVHAQWPYWMHFLAPTAENLALVLLMLSEDAFTIPADTLVHQPTGMNRARIVDLQSAQTLVQHLFASMAVLHAHHGIDPQITTLMRDQFVHHSIFKEIVKIPGKHKN